MPTVRPRHHVTETPEVSRALDLAAERWPGEPRSKLLLRLVQAGGDALQRQSADETGRHRREVLRTKGAYAGLFEPGYLDTLREDWPA